MNNKIFIVEGKSDEIKIKSIFPNINVFKTNGLNLTKIKIETIKKLSATNEIYIFTDPDYIGKKIRTNLNIILNYNCYNIYLINTIIKKGKNGVAEASAFDIKQAFKNKVKLNNNKDLSISLKDYLKLKIDSKAKRIKICKKLNIEYVNNKQLYKFFNYLNLNYETIKGIINE